VGGPKGIVTIVLSGKSTDGTKKGPHFNNAYRKWLSCWQIGRQETMQ